VQCNQQDEYIFQEAMAMTKRISSILFLCCLILLFSPLAASSIKSKAETSLRSFFGASATLKRSTFQIPPSIKTSIEKTVRQRFFRNEVYFWKIELQDGSRAFAILDNVYGKAMPITFLVAFDKQGTVLHSTIVKYREAIGGMVRAAKWQHQFVGRNAESGFAIGKDIDAISGATISTHAVAKGIKKLSLLFQSIKAADTE